MSTPKGAGTEDGRRDRLERAAFPHLDLSCWCWSCDDAQASALPEGDIRRLMRRMNLCPDCGNKRCPRSAHHDRACSGSNEPGQVGSNYPRSAPGVAS